MDLEKRMGREKGRGVMEGRRKGRDETWKKDRERKKNGKVGIRGKGVIGCVN